MSVGTAPNRDVHFPVAVVIVLHRHLARLPRNDGDARCASINGRAVADQPVAAVPHRIVGAPVAVVVGTDRLVAGDGGVEGLILRLIVRAANQGEVVIAAAPERQIRKSVAVVVRRCRDIGAMPKARLKKPCALRWRYQVPFDGR